MADNLSSGSETVGVKPTEVDTSDTQHPLIDDLIARNVFLLTQAPVYQDEAFNPGKTFSLILAL
jgi:hypothetical protein